MDMTIASMIIGASSLLFSFMGLYLTSINILYNLYAHARSKIEANVSSFNSDCKHIPSEEQIKLIEKKIAEAKEALERETEIIKRLLPYFEINLTRYKLTKAALCFLTFGKFKHVV